jgi:hypothetical protein
VTVRALFSLNLGDGFISLKEAKFYLQFENNPDLKEEDFAAVDKAKFSAAASVFTKELDAKLCPRSKSELQEPRQLLQCKPESLRALSYEEQLLYSELQGKVAGYSIGVWATYSVGIILLAVGIYVLFFLSFLGGLFILGFAAAAWVGFVIMLKRLIINGKKLTAMDAVKRSA